MHKRKLSPTEVFIGASIWALAALLGAAHMDTAIYLGHSFVIWDFYSIEDMITWSQGDRFFWILFYGLGAIGGAMLGTWVLSLIATLILPDKEDE